MSDVEGAVCLWQVGLGLSMNKPYLVSLTAQVEILLQLMDRHVNSSGCLFTNRVFIQASSVSRLLTFSKSTATEFVLNGSVVC